MAWSVPELTVSNAPLLKNGETFLTSADGIRAMITVNSRTKPYNGSIHLSTRRLFFVPTLQSADDAISLELCQILESSTEKRFMGTSGSLTVVSNSDQPGQSDPAQIKSSVTWICKICYYSNVGSLNACSNCGVARAPDEVARLGSPDAGLVASSGDDDQVPCKTCTFLNHYTLRNCEICGNELPRRAEKRRVIDESVKFVFLEGGSRKFYAQLLKAVKDLEETTAAAASSELAPLSGLKDLKLANDDSKQPTIFTGIHGIMNESNERFSSNERAISTAMADMMQLNQKANRLFELIDSYRKLDPDVHAIVAGLSGPLISEEMFESKEAYLQQLARQVAEFISDNQLLEGHLMSLHDIYSFYNAARGGETISPSDFRECFNRAEKLELPYRLRELRSGVLVVEAKMYKCAEDRLVDWVRTMEATALFNGVTVLMVSQHFKWSLAISLEELECSEAAGQLCRDEATQRIAFYTNHF